jgi:hypothetical protein
LCVPIGLGHERFDALGYERAFGIVGRLVLLVDASKDVRRVVPQQGERRAYRFVDGDLRVRGLTV